MIATEELDDKSRHGIKSYIAPENLAVELFVFRNEEQCQKNQGLGPRLVELGRMKGNFKRYSCDLLCVGIGECDSPRKRRRFPVTASG